MLFAHKDLGSLFRHSLQSNAILHNAATDEGYEGYIVRSPKDLIDEIRDVYWKDKTTNLGNNGHNNASQNGDNASISGNALNKNDMNGSLLSENDHFVYERRCLENRTTVPSEYKFISNNTSPEAALELSRLLSQKHEFETVSTLRRQSELVTLDAIHYLGVPAIRGDTCWVSNEDIPGLFEVGVVKSLRINKETGGETGGQQESYVVIDLQWLVNGHARVKRCSLRSGWFPANRVHKRESLASLLRFDEFGSKVICPISGIQLVRPFSDWSGYTRITGPIFYTEDPVPAIIERIEKKREADKKIIIENFQKDLERLKKEQEAERLKKEQEAERLKKEQEKKAELKKAKKKREKKSRSITTSSLVGSMITGGKKKKSSMIDAGAGSGSDVENMSTNLEGRAEEKTEKIEIQRTSLTVVNEHEEHEEQAKEYTNTVGLEYTSASGGGYCSASGGGYHSQSEGVADAHSSAQSVPDGSSPMMVMNESLMKIPRGNGNWDVISESTDYGGGWNDTLQNAFGDANTNNSANRAAGDISRGDLSRGDDAKNMRRGDDAKNISRGDDAKNMRRGDNRGDMSRGDNRGDMSRGDNRGDMSRGERSDEEGRVRTPHHVKEEKPRGLFSFLIKIPASILGRPEEQTNVGQQTPPFSPPRSVQDTGRGGWSNRLDLNQVGSKLEQHKPEETNPDEKMGVDEQKNSDENRIPNELNPDTVVNPENPECPAETHPENPAATTDHQDEATGGEIANEEFGAKSSDEQLQSTRAKPLDEPIVSADEKLVSVDEKVGSTDEKLVSVDEKVGSVDEKVGSADEKLVSVDEKVGTVDEKFGSADEKLVSVDEKVVGADANYKGDLDPEYTSSGLEQRNASEQGIASGNEEFPLSPIMKPIHSEAEWPPEREQPRLTEEINEGVIAEAFMIAEGFIEHGDLHDGIHQHSDDPPSSLENTQTSLENLSGTVQGLSGTQARTPVLQPLVRQGSVTPTTPVLQGSYTPIAHGSDIPQGSYSTPGSYNTPVPHGSYHHIQEVNPLRPSSMRSLSLSTADEQGKRGSLRKKSLGGGVGSFGGGLQQGILGGRGSISETSAAGGNDRNLDGFLSERGVISERGDNLFGDTLLGDSERLKSMRRELRLNLHNEPLVKNLRKTHLMRTDTQNDYLTGAGNQVLLGYLLANMSGLNLQSMQSSGRTRSTMQSLLSQEGHNIASSVVMNAILRQLGGNLAAPHGYITPQASDSPIPSPASFHASNFYVHPLPNVQNPGAYGYSTVSDVESRSNRFDKFDYNASDVEGGEMSLGQLSQNNRKDRNDSFTRTLETNAAVAAHISQQNIFSQQLNSELKQQHGEQPLNPSAPSMGGYSVSVGYNPYGGERSTSNSGTTTPGRTTPGSTTTTNVMNPKEYRFYKEKKESLPLIVETDSYVGSLGSFKEIDSSTGFEGDGKFPGYVDDVVDNEAIYEEREEVSLTEAASSPGKRKTFIGSFFGKNKDQEKSGEKPDRNDISSRRRITPASKMIQKIEKTTSVSRKTDKVTDKAIEERMRNELEMKLKEVDKRYLFVSKDFEGMSTIVSDCDPDGDSGYSLIAAATVFRRPNLEKEFLIQKSVYYDDNLISGMVNRHDSRIAARRSREQNSSTLNPSAAQSSTAPSSSSMPAPSSSSMPAPFSGNTAKSSTAVDSPTTMAVASSTMVSTSLKTNLVGARSPKPPSTDTTELSKVQSDSGITFSDQNVEHFDIRQQNVGNCWLMGILSGCVYRRDNAEDFVISSLNWSPAHGVLSFKLCLDGQPRWILLDDRIPVQKNDPSNLKFASSAVSGELWVALMEKAFAKWAGCYQNLRGGLQNIIIPIGSLKAMEAIAYASDLEEYELSGQLSSGLIQRPTTNQDTNQNTTMQGKTNQNSIANISTNWKFEGEASSASLLKEISPEGEMVPVATNTNAGTATVSGVNQSGGDPGVNVNRRNDTGNTTDLALRMKDKGQDKDQKLRFEDLMRLKGGKKGRNLMTTSGSDGAHGLIRGHVFTVLEVLEIPIVNGFERFNKFVDNLANSGKDTTKTGSGRRILKLVNKTGCGIRFRHYLKGTNNSWRGVDLPKTTTTYDFRMSWDNGIVKWNYITSQESNQFIAFETLQVQNGDSICFAMPNQKQGSTITSEISSYVELAHEIREGTTYKFWQQYSKENVARNKDILRNDQMGTGVSSTNLNTVVNSTSLNADVNSTSLKTDVNSTSLNNTGVVTNSSALTNNSIKTDLILSTTVPLQLVKLRNPWGHSEWNGLFSDESVVWLILPEVVKQLNLQIADDGIFYMSWIDFETHFSHLVTCSEVTGSVDNFLPFATPNINLKRKELEDHYFGPRSKRLDFEEDESCSTRCCMFPFRSFLERIIQFKRKKRKKYDKCEKYERKVG